MKNTINYIKKNVIPALLSLIVILLGSIVSLIVYIYINDMDAQSQFNTDLKETLKKMQIEETSEKITNIEQNIVIKDHEGRIVNLEGWKNRRISGKY